MLFRPKTANRRGCPPVERHNLSGARHGAEDVLGSRIAGLIADGGADAAACAAREEAAGTIEDLDPMGWREYCGLLERRQNTPR